MQHPAYIGPAIEGKIPIIDAIHPLQVDHCSGGEGFIKMVIPSCVDVHGQGRLDFPQVFGLFRGGHKINDLTQRFFGLFWLIGIKIEVFGAVAVFGEVVLPNDLAQIDKTCKDFNFIVDPVLGTQINGQSLISCPL